jgi:hypothetical protein
MDSHCKLANVGVKEFDFNFLLYVVVMMPMHLDDVAVLLILLDAVC